MTTPALQSQFDWNINWWGISEAHRQRLERLLEDVSGRLGLPCTATLKQLQVILDQHRGFSQPLLVGGGKGGGKSRLIGIMGVWLCELIPENRVGMYRLFRSSFEDTTLKEVEPLIPADCKRRDNWWTFPNGSELFYDGLLTKTQSDKVESLQLGAAFVDEVDDCDEDSIFKLRTRVRLPVAKAANQIRVVFTVNPTPGWVRDQFIGPNRKPNYGFIQALALDNPHLYGGDPHAYIREMKETLPDHLYRAWVLGDWEAFVPTDAAIPEPLLLEAVKRSEYPRWEDYSWGIDCGRSGGDETSIWGRAGAYWFQVDSWEKSRLTTTADRIANKLRTAEHIPQIINVDATGLGGGLDDILVRYVDEGLMPDIIINELNKQDSPMNPALYANLDAELAFMLKAILERNRGQIVDNGKVVTDLASPRLDQRSRRLKIESNQIVKMRIGRSPNDGDALKLSCYTGMGASEYVPYHRPDPNSIESEELRQIALREREHARRFGAGIQSILDRGGRFEGSDVGYDDELGY